MVVPELLCMFHESVSLLLKKVDSQKLDKCLLSVSSLWMGSLDSNKQMELEDADVTVTGSPFLAHQEGEPTPSAALSYAPV